MCACMGSLLDLNHTMGWGGLVRFNALHLAHSGVLVCDALYT